MSYYIEWVEKPEFRCGGMVPIAKAAQMVRLGLSGFTTVYQFEKPAAEIIIQSRKSKGFKNFVTSTTVLIMDCDEGEEGRANVEKRLSDLGVGYTLWLSGGKGYHFYLKLTERLSGVHVPYSQKRWVIDNGLSGLVDMSLYKASSLISAPGRVHHKTGVKKTFLAQIPGKEIAVTYIEPEILASFEFGTGDDADAYVLGMLQVTDLITEPQAGNRHTKIWSTSQLLRDAGMHYETCRDLVLFINSKWPNGKNPDEVIRAIDQAYEERS